ncbi:glycosyltransferase, partial [bacterium]|nr:glycosyltransferase [bacterium]
FEVVYGIRKKRKEFILKRMAYSIFYRLLKKISNVNIPLDSGDFSIIDKKIVATMKQMEERNRFVRGIRSWIGFRQTGLEYERDKRYAGEVKYNLRKLIRLAFDGLLSFSYVPLQAASLMGFIISFVSFFGILVVIFLRLFTDLSIPGFASTAVLILFLGGIQLITIGIIGEYVGRIYDEVKQRPLYIKKESIGFD